MVTASIYASLDNLVSFLLAAKEDTGVGGYLPKEIGLLSSLEILSFCKFVRVGRMCRYL